MDQNDSKRNGRVFSNIFFIGRTASERYIAKSLVGQDTHVTVHSNRVGPDYVAAGELHAAGKIPVIREQQQPLRVEVQTPLCATICIFENNRTSVEYS